MVRHGPAEARDPRRWPDDEHRPLSGPGVAETEGAARGLARFAPGPYRFASSPAERAWATARIFHEALGASGPVARWPELRPDSPAGPVLARVADEARRDDRLVVVSHEPILSELVGLALSGEAISLIHIARAGAASLAFEGRVGPGAGRLDWLMPRRALGAFARR